MVENDNRNKVFKFKRAYLDKIFLKLKNYLSMHRKQCYLLNVS